MYHFGDLRGTHFTIYGMENYPHVPVRVYYGSPALYFNPLPELYDHVLRKYPELDQVAIELVGTCIPTKNYTKWTLRANRELEELEVHRRVEGLYKARIGVTRVVFRWLSLEDLI